MSSMLPRSLVSDFVRIEGLQKQTNVSAHDWDIYILKELVDNGLDADEMTAGVSGLPRIEAEIRYAGHGLEITVRNKAPFPIASVAEVFDLDKRASAKDFQCLPTRGNQGHALKTLLGIPYALHYFFYSEYPTPGSQASQLKPFTIRSGSTQVDVYLDVDESHQVVRSHQVIRYNLPYPVEGTEINIAIRRFRQARPRTADALLDMARSFACWNPHADFTFTFVVDGEPYSFESAGDRTWSGKYDLRQPAPLIWYATDQFRELLHALILHAEQHGKRGVTLAEVAKHFGIDMQHSVGKFEPQTRLEDYLQGSYVPKQETDRLYDAFLQLKAAHSEPSLGSIGAEHLARHAGVQTPADGRPVSFYETFASKASEGNEPFVLEVMLCGSRDGRRHVITGINNTPTYRDPFFNKPLIPRGQTEPQRSLEKLLDHYELRDSVPITFFLHLIAPAKRFENFGKSAVSDEAYRPYVTELVDVVAQKYRDATRPAEYIDQISVPARRLLPNVMQHLPAPFTEQQLLAALKRALRALDESVVTAALNQVGVDIRLRAVIGAYQQESGATGMIRRQTGTLALPRHPFDTMHVAIASRRFLDTVKSALIRAILVASRSEIEDLLLALDIPLRYDIALLRAEGNLLTSFDALAKRLTVLARSSAEDGLVSPLPIWVVRDASADGAMLSQELRQRLRIHGFAPECVVDLGLRMTDVAVQDAWVEIAAQPPMADRAALRAARVGDDEIALYVDQRQSTRLDSLSSSAIVAWLECRLEELGLARKLVPPVDGVADVSLDWLRGLLRRQVEHVAFNMFRLDDVVEHFERDWHTEQKDWTAFLYEQLLNRLRERPELSWRHALEDVMKSRLDSYMTAERVAELRGLMRNQR